MDNNNNFARQNNATEAQVDNSIIFATGAFKNVYKGKYTKGEREGEDCVAKSFISGSVFEESYFAAEMKVVARALKVINGFNVDHIINKAIWLNEPTIWTYIVSKEKTLIEPMIHNFEKFNSNTGWTSSQQSAWIEVMQALSHYSYHSSQRQVLLCDLQGGVYKDGFIITDPVIMSLTNEYGPTDLGSKGISTFFARHKCNQYCNAQWMKPADKNVYFNSIKGTSMILPTRHSRATLPY